MQSFQNQVQLAEYMANALDKRNNEIRYTHKELSRMITSCQNQGQFTNFFNNYAFELQRYEKQADSIEIQLMQTVKYLIKQQELLGKPIKLYAN